MHEDDVIWDALTMLLDRNLIEIANRSEGSHTHASESTVIHADSASMEDVPVAASYTRLSLLYAGVRIQACTRMKLL